MACVNGEYYHIVNRGVEGRTIFTSTRDFNRFKRGLLLFNTTGFTELRTVSERVFLQKLASGKVSRLVDVIAYCLLGNHFHLFVRQNVDKGVETFLRKLLGGYTRFFNIVKKRRGVLFQSHSRIIHVNHETYFDHVPRYIILNSLDSVDIRWRVHGVTNTQIIKKILIEYPYSSFNGMIQRGLDPILSDDLIGEVLDRKNFLNDLLAWSSENYIDAKPVLIEP